MDLKEKAYLCSLHSINGIGIKSLWKIKEVFGSFQACCQSSNNELRASFLAKDVVESIISIKNRDPVADFEQMAATGIRMVTWDEDAYPAMLRHIHNPPYVLYYRGRIECLTGPAIALVGSRMASYYGKNTARKIGRDLAARGVVVVSGLARGIDSEAHRGALESGQTVAVLGCGLDVIYPPENNKLYSEIAANGAVISEFPRHTGPEPGNFPMRNRIISGLCRGVVVVEAQEKSGALITADFALEQGRDVFAVPGPVNSKTSIGTNNLIKQGAKLVSSLEDIIEEYGDLYSPGSGAPEQAVLPLLSKEENEIIEAIDSEPGHFDYLLDQTGLNIGQLSTLLLQLELRGIITALPGNYYIKQS
ncbi:MAG: DNA-processing protein DprA [Deltaproteobacteria bacterium]